MVIKNYCIIIPAYQAVNTLPELLVLTLNIVDAANIFIVDDGSTDGTATLVRHYPQINFISHEINRGKGAALMTGIRAALQAGFRYAVCLDADLQHEPRCIPDFILAQKHYQADLVLGKRHFEVNTMPFHRILSNTITSLLISIRTGKRVHDSQCGYRLINLELFTGRKFAEDGFQFESEFLIKLLLAGTRHTEVAIPTIYNNAGSSIHNVRDTLKFISLFFRSYFWT